MKENKYLSALIPILKEEGLALSIDAMAQKIGVSRKTLYNRFSSKDQLIQGCLNIVSGDFRASLACMDDDSLPVEERFKQGISALRHYFRDMSRVFMKDLMELYPGMASLDHSSGSGYFARKLAENIEKGKATGVYRQDIDSELFSRYISFSIFAFFKKEVMMGNTYSSDYYFEQVINFNINALLAKQL